jgi:hypothetical protein
MNAVGLATIHTGPSLRPNGDIFNLHDSREARMCDQSTIYLLLGVDWAKAEFSPLFPAESGAAKLEIAARDWSIA